MALSSGAKKFFGLLIGVALIGGGGIYAVKHKAKIVASPAAEQVEAKEEPKEAPAAPIKEKEVVRENTGPAPIKKARLEEPVKRHVEKRVEKPAPKKHKAASTPSRQTEEDVNQKALNSLANGSL